MVEGHGLCLAGYLLLQDQRWLPVQALISLLTPMKRTFWTNTAPFWTNTTLFWRPKKAEKHITGQAEELNYTRYKFQCHRSFALGPSSPHCPSPSPLHFVRSILRPVPFHTLKWRGRKKCVAQEHNKMSPTKAEVTCGLVSVTIHSMLPIDFPGRLFQHSIQDTIHTSLL